MHLLQEFYFFCPPGVRGQLGRRAGPGKRALPEAECLTPASKRARLTYLATTKDGNKAPSLPDDLVHILLSSFPSLIRHNTVLLQHHFRPACYGCLQESCTSTCSALCKGP